MSKKSEDPLGAATCSACGGGGMLPGQEEDDDVMNAPCWKCNERAKACGNCGHRGDIFGLPRTCSAVWDAAKSPDVEYPGLVQLNPYNVECKYHGPRPVEDAVGDGLIAVGDSVIGHGGGQQYLLTLLFKGTRIRVWYLRWRSIRELPLPPMQDGDEVVGSSLPPWMEWFYLPNAIVVAPPPSESDCGETENLMGG